MTTESAHSDPTRRGVLLIVSGPAGVGKTTLCEQLVEHYPDIRRMVTTTTRAPRKGEIDGVDYHFLSREAFEQKVAENAFIEWAQVHHNYYGSQRRHIEEILSAGLDVLLNIDVQGARSFREKVDKDPQLAGGVVTVFIRPKSIEQVKERLQQRGTDESAEIQRRLETAEWELKEADAFDYSFVSGDRIHDFQALQAIYEKCRQTGLDP